LDEQHERRLDRLRHRDYAFAQADHLENLWREDHKEMNATEAQEKLGQGVQALVTSEQWKNALGFAAKFHQYSFGNTMLIYLQCPNATRVAGFHRWLSLHRFVRKGETGIAILAPVISKISREVEGETKTLQKLRGFKTTYVFDVTQTEGEELPPSPESFVHRLQGGTDADRDLFGRLCQLIALRGWGAGTSPMADQPDETNGYADFTTKIVHVRWTLSDAQRLKTLLHEFAHVILHNPELYKGNRGLCETEAESAAYITSLVLGLDTSSYSFGYVAGWSGGKTEIVEQAGRHALSAAEQILRALGVNEQEQAA